MAKITEVARTLFQELRDKQSQHMTTVNAWVDATSEHKNIPIFLTKAAEGEKQAFCVMLKKALLAGDFSAFQHPNATEPEDKKDEPEPPTELEEPPAPKEKTPPPPKEDEPEPEEDAPTPPSGTLDTMVATMVGALVSKKLHELPKQAEGKPVSEERIREIIREEIKAQFKKMMG
jgi:biotin carboxyl carrier protein